MTDDIRGSAPVLSTKDIILDIWHDTKAMKSQVDVLVSQELNKRLNEVEREIPPDLATRLEAIEARHAREDGRTNLFRAVFGTSMVAGIFGIVDFLKDTLHVHF